MAIVKIAGDSVVIESAKTLEQIKTLEKYRPSALSLFEVDDDGCKTEVFRVMTGAGNGVLNKNGAIFCSETHDDRKLACITMCIPAGTANAVEYVADKLGVAITMLNKVEAQFEDAMVVVEAEKAAVRACIQTV